MYPVRLSAKQQGLLECRRCDCDRRIDPWIPGCASSFWARPVYVHALGAFGACPREGAGRMGVP